MSTRYELLREAGSGARAVVFLARDLKHDRLVALKVLRPEFSASVGAERFQKEIGIAARMAHPHILPLFDSGEAAGALYYVMPFVEGETLRDRLRRHGRLSLPEAIRIAGEVADALSYAHRQGVIHRDIKPENILLEEGRAVVADFGIARAIAAAEDETLTATGIAIGTPQYMSPEQGLGTVTITESTDIYGLGCVLFEMLVGDPPFTAPSPRAVIAQKLHQHPPSPLSRRPEVPVWLDRLVLKMLARDPGDRFPTAEGLSKEIAAHTGPSLEEPSDSWIRWAYRIYRRRWPLLAGAAILLIVGLLSWIDGGIPGIGGDLGTPPDTTRYAVFSFGLEGNPGSSLNAVHRLNEALGEWSGITVVEPTLVREAEARMQSTRISVSEAAEAARNLGAGRFVLGSEVPLGGEVRVSAELFESSGSSGPLASSSIRIPASLGGADSLFCRLAEVLLFRDALAEGDAPSFGTRDFVARHAFLRGERSLEAWDLAAAQAAFSDAVEADWGYAEAHLWLALSEAWRGLDPSQWRGPAVRATQGTGLSPRDSLMAVAIRAESQGEFPRGCELWNQLTLREPGYYAGWYGSAVCQVADDVVLPNPASPSGWSFRSSYHHALLAFERAFELFPAILASYREASFDGLRRLFMTTANSRRSGRSPTPDEMGFTAVPAWRGDTLALVPYRSEPTEVELTAPPEEIETAVRRMRARFRDVARAWAASSPDNADAAEALAISMTMLSDPGALDEILRARSLVATDEERFRTATVEVWIRLAFALPSDTAGIRRAAALADSILSGPAVDGAGDPLLMAGLAGLLGRGHLAANLVRGSDLGSPVGEAVSFSENAPALLMYAALGGPADSLRLLERRVSDAVDDLLRPEAQVQHRLAWLARAGTLAFSECRMESVRSLRGQGDVLLDAQASLEEGDTLPALRGLDALQSHRSGLHPSSLTLDALLPEAALLAEMGEDQAAADRLDPTLRAMGAAVPRVMADPLRGAVLVRAAELRAILAHRLGDADGASLWREAVTTLWSDADPFLEPRLTRLKELF